MKGRRRLSLSGKHVDIVAQMSGKECFPLDVLDEMRSKAELCDVKILLEDSSVVCAHRLVLCCHSSYFRVMFVNQQFRESKLVEIPLKQVPENIFQYVLRFIYTGKCRLPQAQLFEVLQCANMLDFSRLVELICETLARNISIDNCLDMLAGAEAVGVLQLRQTCFRYVLKNFSIAVVSCKRAFLALDEALLKELLEKDSLSASEEFTFEIAVDWLRATKASEKTANEILGMVRFPLMEPGYVHRKILQDLRLLREFPVLLELSREADKHFALKKAGYNVHVLAQTKRSTPRKQQFHSLVSNRFLAGHKRAVTCLLKYEDKVLSGSYDRSIKMWNTETWESENSVKTDDPVLCLLAFGEEVMSGDSAGFIVVWNTSTWERRGRLSGHSDAVSCLLSCNARVISGSYDRSIKVWNPASWQCERILLHSRAVTCLLQNEDKMLSGSYDKTIKVWNTRNWSCEHTLQEHVSYVTCLSNCRGKVLSGSRDNTIKVWDAKTWKCIRQLSAHNNAISCFLNCGDKLLSCSVDNTFKVWNPFTWECEKSITQDRADFTPRFLSMWQKHRVRSINCLVQYGDKVLSGTNEKSITVWNITTHNSQQTNVETTQAG